MLHKNISVDVLDACIIYNITVGFSFYILAVLGKKLELGNRKRNYNCTKAHHINDDSWHKKTLCAQIYSITGSNHYLKLDEVPYFKRRSFVQLPTRFYLLMTVDNTKLGTIIFLAQTYEKVKQKQGSRQRYRILCFCVCCFKKKPSA